jgi:hypothetical protein
MMNMGRKLIRKLTQSDIEYSLLKVSSKESEIFPETEFTLLLDDGRELRTTYDKRNNRLTSRGAIQRYYTDKGLRPGDTLTIEELEKGKKYSLTSEKSVETPLIPETAESVSDYDEKYTSFALEEHLRRYLVRNLEHVEKGLRLFEDKDGRNGEEYSTSVGNIDILCLDANSDFVVFELKVSRGSDATVGQLLRYKGWVQKHLASGKKVRGIIVANEIDEKLKYASAATADLVPYEYEISFRLNKAAL